MTSQVLTSSLKSNGQNLSLFSFFSFSSVCWSLFNTLFGPEFASGTFFAAKNGRLEKKNPLVILAFIPPAFQRL